MNPLILQALLSFAPSLLGSLFGRNDPAKEREAALMKLFAPGNIGKQANSLFQLFQGSPAYSAAQGGIAAGTNTLTNSLQRSLGARGISQSGIGAVAPALARSTAGFNMANLNSQGWQDSLKQALSLIQGQAGALGGTPLPPNYGNELFGAGLDRFGPLLQEWLKNNQKQKETPKPDFGPPSGSTMGSPGWLYPRA